MILGSPTTTTAIATLAGNSSAPIKVNAAGTTRSAIADGTVTITDAEGQKARTGKTAEETIASLNRDTENANESVGEIFDAEKIKEQQTYDQLKQQTLQQAAPYLYDVVGDQLKGKPEVVKVAVHGLIGGLVSKALGGEFGSGAAGVAAATAAIALLDDNLGSLGVEPGTRDKMLQVVGMAVAKIIGGDGASGNAAAATAGMADAYNRQLHKDERQWAKDNAEKFADFYEKKTGDKISIQDAETLLLSGGYRMVDAAASRAPGADAAATEYISANAGDLFAASATERRNPGVSQGISPEQFALNTPHTPNTQPMSWAVSLGAYYGVGAEFELGFTGLAPTEGKLGFGVGLGAHGWLAGTGYGANADLVSFGQSIRGGDYRVGSSLSLSGMFGSVAVQAGGGAGLYSTVVDKPNVGGYWQAKSGLAVSPAIGLGVEAKINIIEFSYKHK